MVAGTRGRSTPSPTDPLRVLWVIKCLGYGGAERLLVDMVAAGDRSRFDYEVAYVLRDKDALVPFIESEGTPVHSLGARHDADLRWMRSLRRLLHRAYYDVVHFHLPYTAALGPAGRGSRCRRPTGPGWSTPSTASGTGHPGSAKPSSGSPWVMSQRLVTVSRGRPGRPPRAAAATITHGRPRCRSLPSPTRLWLTGRAVRAAVRAELGVDDGELLFITVANLRSREGVRRAARCSPDHCRSQAPGPHGGSRAGAPRWVLHARHIDLGLGDQFQFLGEREDVLRLLAGSDAFVLASRHEGLPVVLMEATSVGLPIVATDVGGVPQVLTDEVDSLIVPSGDPEALADAIGRLALDPGLRERLGGRQRCGVRCSASPKPVVRWARSTWT